MINLQFFPSRRLALYMAKLFLVRSFAVLVSLVMILMTLDLLGESGKILAVPGNGEAELWTYVSLRVPQLVSRFLPFSVLLGTLITFAGLNQHSEVIAMKAAGLSAHQILAPLIVVSTLIAGLHFAFNERIVTAATRTAKAWEAVDYQPIPPSSGILNNVWLLNGDDLVRARYAGVTRTGFRLEGVTLYEREGGAISRIVTAQRATPKDGAWRLEAVEIYDSKMNLRTRRPSLLALQGVDPRRFTLAKVDPEERNFFTLSRTIAEMKDAGRPTTEALTGYWHKLSGPISTILMPLLAAVAAFGLARSGQVLLRATIGMALGFTYFVVDNFSMAMGNVGAYSPFLAAWAPVLLFVIIGELILIQSEE